MTKQTKIKYMFKFASIMAAVILLAIIAAFADGSFVSRLTGNGTKNIDADLVGVVEAFAEENGIDYNDYPNELLELLERNPETKDFVLSYPLEKDSKYETDLSEFENCEAVPLFMQWDKRWGYIEYGSSVAGVTGCGPVCLSMCAYYLTGNNDFSPDKMIDFAKDNGYSVKGKGSSWSLISEGGEELGFDVEELPLVEKKITDNLQEGNPIICVMGPGDFTTTGHFIVLADYDSENGVYKINDPNSGENSRAEWEYEDFSGQIKNLWVISK